MNKADVGAALAAALSVLASLAVMAREYAGRAFEYLRVSFVALVSSKAAWAAVIATALVAFVIGHVEGASGKRALRSEVMALKTRVQNTEAAAKASVARETEAKIQVETLKRTIEAQKAEIHRLAGQRAPVAPVSRPAAPKAPQNKPAAREPARAWAPWQS